MKGSSRPARSAADWQLSRLLALAALVIAVLFAIARPASAEYGITSFRASAIAADGTDETRAGVHPYAAQVDFRVRTFTDSSGEFVDGHMKNVVTDLPVGFIGDPQSLPTCKRIDLINNACPPSSQVGVVKMYQVYFATSEQTVPVYNLEPGRGKVADFGFQVLSVPIHINISLRNDDYGVRATIENISQMVPVYGAQLTLWGYPTDPVHDEDRGWIDNGFGGTITCADTPDPTCRNTAGIPRTAFLTNPTFCGERLTTRLAVDSWREPGAFATAESVTDSPVTDCEGLTFSPTLRLRPDTTQADTSTGLTVDLNIPQVDGWKSRVAPTLRKASVQLPDGVSINPASADKLVGCRDDQIKIGSGDAVTCPDASKIGDVTIHSPLLKQELAGPIYLGDPLPGKRYRIFLDAFNDEYGLAIRVEGVLQLDPVSGRITTVFDNLPQLPFDNLRLRFKGGPRAPLATSPVCNATSTVSQLTPWAAGDAQPVTTIDPISFNWDGSGAPCPGLGLPSSFRAGMTNAAAGQDSAFNVLFGRQDREQELKNLDITTPPGLLGRIANVPLCAEAAANAGACGAESQIGTTTVASGAGSSPLFLGGKVFLTGGYKGAPFGLSIAVPAKAGPYDLGLVVVRASIFVDRNDAHLRIVSDDFPRILDGIPLRIKNIAVAIDRGGFMFNPTNCSAKSIAGKIGASGGVASYSSRFQVAGCSALAFKPKMTLKVGAKGKLTSGKRTPLEVTLAMTPRQANNRSVQVTLPLSLNARLDVVNKRRACSIDQFNADRCPMTVGEATAVTPLLRDPLKGPAYFVYNPDRRLPDLVVRLKGQVNIDLVGKVTITRDLRLQTTFDTVPDVPITKFRLALASGGTNGPIGVVRNLCSATTRKGLKAGLAYVAQNGKKVRLDQQISVAGCGKTRSTKRAAKK